MEAGGYAPAPLDTVSFVNGVLKWEHFYGCVPRWLYPLMLQWLEYEFGVFLEVPQWSFERVRQEMDRDKACGPPYCTLFGVTKGDFLDNMSDAEILRDFELFIQLVNGTLKDELRVVVDGLVKDARFFTPANAVMIFVGNWLFGAQNESLELNHRAHPIKVGLSTPGGESYTFWRKYARLTGLCYQFDGAGNDAHFCPILACVARDFRKRHLPESVWWFVDKYYDMTYRMMVNVRGAVINLIGQQTGQTNTAMDNSLGTVMMVQAHALLQGLTFEEYRQLNLFVVGDDMLLRDPSGLFQPLFLEKTWHLFGMYLESPGIQNSEDMTFIGMHPCQREVFGKVYELYSYNIAKMLSSLNFVRRSNSIEQRLQKIVSLTHLVFAHRETYELMREVCFRYARVHLQSLSRQGLDWLGSLTDLHQLIMYCGFEPTV